MNAKTHDIIGNINIILISSPLPKIKFIGTSINRFTGMKYVKSTCIAILKNVIGYFENDNKKFINVAREYLLLSLNAVAPKKIVIETNIVALDIILIIITSRFIYVSSNFKTNPDIIISAKELMTFNILEIDNDLRIRCVNGE